MSTATAAPAPTTVRQDGPQVTNPPVRYSGTRYTCISKTPSEGEEWCPHKKLYKKFFVYEVVLECTTKVGVAGRIELRYLSEAQAKDFEVGQLVSVNFHPVPPAQDEKAA